MKILIIAVLLCVGSPVFAFEGCQYVQTIQGLFIVCCQQGVCIATKQ